MEENKMTEEKIVYDSNEFVIEEGVLLQYLGNKTTVRVPEGVTEISAEAFLFTDPYGNLRNKNIINLYLPESVKEMKCKLPSSLQKFIGPGLTVVYGNQFKGTNIIEFDGPNVLNVGSKAFAECLKLIKVNLPKVTYLEEGAFSYCQIHESGINIPHLKKIEGDVFESNQKLINVNFTELEYIGRGAFARCGKLETVNCPKVREVHNSAFALDQSLRQINMPLAQIYGDNVFNDCRNLSAENVKMAVEFKNKSGGCYVATCVYGSYDCPEVWTLRRFRDIKLASSWYGRLFIKVYYSISPTLVKWFGNTTWFKSIWQGPLDNLVKKLNCEGYDNSPYND